ncbi:hypothetical protein KSS87_006480, partial [Heliosperma pusillum]
EDTVLVAPEERKVKLSVAIIKNYWDEMKKRGEVVPYEREDVVVKATRKFDRPGFTRGVRGAVGLTSFFGKSNNPGANKKLYTEDDFRLFKEEAKKEAMVEVQSLNSCHSTKLDDHFLELEGPVPCRQAVFVAESKIVVAEGTMGMHYFQFCGMNMKGLVRLSKALHNWLNHCSARKKVQEVVDQECRQQPRSYECGYYVMKWMYDITLHYASSEDDIEKCVSGTEMNTELMDEFRELWPLYCVKNI